MSCIRLTRRTACLSLAALAAAPAAPAVSPRSDGGAADPLPSWNDTDAKRAIVDFVRGVTTRGRNFIAPAERIAAFDNDGTLWVSHPIYVEFQFTLDRAREMMARDSALAQRAPFDALAAMRPGAPPDLNEQQLGALLLATHAGMTPEAFESDVRRWLASARHPRFHRPYTECVYQPMLETLAYLRANGFKTFIVSGGGVDFMRAFAERTYGVPPEQVIGSSGQARFELRNGVGTIIKEPRLGSIDDKQGKPINIALQIGRRPIAAFGNSDGDQQMLEYASTGDGRRLAMLVHHDDAVREYAYDHRTKVGRLSAALEDEARARGGQSSVCGATGARSFPRGAPSQAG